MTNKNSFKWFYNTKLSCSYDSFYCIFANNIFSSIYNINYNNMNFYNDDFNHILFLYIMDFIKRISTLNFNKYLSFYNIYINYINELNLFNFMLILEEKINSFIPITTVYRPFWNNKFFTVKYSKYSKCNDNSVLNQVC